MTRASSPPATETPGPMMRLPSASGPSTTRARCIGGQLMQKPSALRRRLTSASVRTTSWFSTPVLDFSGSQRSAANTDEYWITNTKARTVYLVATGRGGQDKVIKILPVGYSFITYWRCYDYCWYTLSRVHSTIKRIRVESQGRQTRRKDCFREGRQFIQGIRRNMDHKKRAPCKGVICQGQR